MIICSEFLVNFDFDFIATKELQTRLEALHRPHLQSAEILQTTCQL